MPHKTYLYFQSHYWYELNPAVNDIIVKNMALCQEVNFSVLLLVFEILFAVLRTKDGHLEVVKINNKTGQWLAAF